MKKASPENEHIRFFKHDGKTLKRENEPEGTKRKEDVKKKENVKEKQSNNEIWGGGTCRQNWKSIFRDTNVWIDKK